MLRLLSWYLILGGICWYMVWMMSLLFLSFCSWWVSIWVVGFFRSCLSLLKCSILCLLSRVRMLGF